MIDATRQPERGTQAHRQWLRRLEGLLAHEYDPAPGRGCWQLVRAALEALGVQTPVEYAEAAGTGVSMPPDQLHRHRIGDVLLMRARRGDGCMHVGVLLGDRRLLHAQRGRTAIDRFRPIFAVYAPLEICRPKAFLAPERT